MYLRACAIRTRPSGQLGILSKEQYSPAATAAEPTHVQLHVHSLCISMATYVRTHACQLPGIHACTYYMSATCQVRCACEANVQKATWHASCMRDRYGATINHGQHMSFQVFKLRLAPYPSVVNIYKCRRAYICRHAYVKSGTEYCTCARTCMYVVLRRRCLRAYVYDFG
jgi:hypothetical protein